MVPIMAPIGYIIQYLVMDIVDTSFIRQVEKVPRQVRPEGLASQSFSISPEQSLGEYSVRNRTTLESFFPCVIFQLLAFNRLATS